jgi:hypothetical protein
MGLPSNLGPVLIVIACMGGLGMLIALAKGRSLVLGFMLGMTGMVGWIILALLPGRAASRKLAEELFPASPRRPAE